MSSVSIEKVLFVDDEAVLHACLELRKEVFVGEQNVPIEEELDEYDFLDVPCWHFVVFAPSSTASSSSVIGTARYIVSDGKCKAQRVVVAKDARGTGVGRLLMEAIHVHAKEKGLSEVILGAQLVALPFYERLAYEAYGPIFDDAGIDHRMMRRSL
ncbi:MAG: GNAT family N-acetyltransferase [Deltaproteobacteria bacterium]|nr:GNAT family N-acetyltransferase [Deltaproteobacteria bacterium]